MNFTLEESTTEKVPPLLDEIIRRLVSQCQVHDSLQKDFLYILIVVLMIENGFVPISQNCEVIDLNSIDIELLSAWKTPLGIYESLFILSGFKTITLKLLMSPLGSTVLLNIVIVDLYSETYSVCLPVSRYVVSPQASTIPMIFRDLKHLSLTLKNKVISAAKSKILSHFGYASASLIGLPEEVLYKIMLYLPVTDIMNICKTCNRLKIILESDSFWHSLCKRDFPEIGQSESSWKIFYREKYEEKLNRVQSRTLRAAGTMHDYMDYSDYVSYIDNPMWNVII